MTDRASAEGHRYDHDGMHRHHHEYGPTGRAIWWEYADQFGGDLTEHTHADRASAEGLPDGICDITGARHPDLVSRKDVAALRDTAEGLLSDAHWAIETLRRNERTEPDSPFWQGWDAALAAIEVALRAEVARLSTPDLPAGWLHGPTGDDGKPIVLATLTTTDTMSSQTSIPLKIRAEVKEIIAVLGPTPPDCGCEGCRVEMQMALDNARAILAAIDAPETSDRIENGWSEYDAPPPGDSDR